MIETIVHDRCSFLAALLLTFATAPLGLGQATVRLNVDSLQVYANEPFVVTIRVNDFTECGSPSFPDIPNCVIRELAGGMDSVRTTIVNGRKSVSRTRTYLYEVTPRKAGQLVIPPVSVEVDGRTIQTEKVRLTVRPSEIEELFAVDISCARQRIYIGQRVRLIMTIWVKPVRTQGRRLSTNDMMSFLYPIEFGPFPTDNIQTDTRHLDQPDGSSELYYIYQTWTDFVPDRPGRLSFDEVAVGIKYPTRLTRDLFGKFRPASYRNLRARPKVQEIEVLSLPPNGRPANFTGAVGTYNITVIAEPTSVRVGDPITLTIEIRGDGPIETLPPPDLAADPFLPVSFRVPREKLAGEANGSRKRFTQVIRAARANVTEIPAIEYPYFDPDLELYIVALSTPIPLVVAPAAELDAEALVEIAGVPSEQPTAELRVLDGLRGNETHEHELLRGASTLSLHALVLVMFVPPAIFLLAWGGATYVQRRGPVQRRSGNALRNARRRLERARSLPPREAVAEVAAALAGYLADRLNEPVARFTGQTAVEFLQQRQITPETLNRWRDVIERCEQTSFGGIANGDTATLSKQARECLRALERERL